ncbi:MAG TPA: hypothetical protein VHC22_07035 [Pirellulales bacterium]|nr:hypothetical protein [Pirellulales bacterium]
MPRPQFTLRALLVVMATACVATGGYFVVKRQQIASLDRALVRAPLGSTAADLEKDLGAPQAVRGMGNLFIAAGPTLGVHDWQRDCVEQRIYFVETFFLPVTYVFGFDERGRLAAKFRID